MKSRDSALRLKRFDVLAKARKVTDIEHMIGEFERMAADLERQVQVEEDRTGVRDPVHFSYSTYAKAAARRRDNLRISTASLRDKLQIAIRERDDAQDELKKVGAPEGRDIERPRRTAMRQDGELRR